MPEADVINRTTEGPITRRRIAGDLTTLGVKEGMVLMVHSALSSLGWVSGGAPAVILGLQDALGETGTLVMPAHSGHYSDPSHWENPPVPEAWIPRIRESMPAFDPDLTPTRGVGAIPECFRKQRGVIRSFHPQGSFTARGPRAEQILADHQLDFSFGEGSPLAKIYQRGGWILLLGVGQDSNTSLHLAEYRAAGQDRKIIQQGAPVLVMGDRQWVHFRELDEASEIFPEIGAAYLAGGGTCREGRVGEARASLFPQRELVDFGVEWLRERKRVQDHQG